MRLVDESGVEVGVDRHLLAGQSVEGKTGSDFGGAHRAVADHDVLDSDQRQKKHEADHIVAAHHELSEGFNDAPGRRCAFIAMQQDAAAGSQVQ